MKLNTRLLMDVALQEPEGNMKGKKSLNINHDLTKVLVVKDVLQKAVVAEGVGD
jgi:hypothetical protein